MNNDHVDKALEQWASERPDLDTQSMAITGRILRIAAFFQEEMQKTFQQFGLNRASFDLMATLLRTGSPYCLSPNELLASSMVTSGTMTNRIDRLVDAGLVNRTQNNHDKRSFSIALTDKGYELINKAIEAHTQTLCRLTTAIPDEEHSMLVSLLKKITLHFEDKHS